MGRSRLSKKHSSMFVIVLPVNLIGQIRAQFDLILLAHC